MGSKSIVVIFNILFLLYASVSYSQSIKFKGEGITCSNIFLSDGNEKIDHTSYVYGSKFYINFENLEGFQSIDKKYYPGMGLYVIGEKGDTVLSNEDMYASLTEGTDIDPLTLNCNVTVATPIHSNENYVVYVHIFDKKGNGTFDASLDFKVIPNEHIRVDSYKLDYHQIYLFSQERGTVITENQGGFNEHIYLLVEGLEGVKEKNGQGEIGLSIKAVDAEGNVIANEPDLFEGQSFNMVDIRKQIAPNLIINKGLLVNPVYFEVIIWDKNSKARITAWVELEIL